MLMVIFGAGASHDAADRRLRSPRVPVVKGLFDYDGNNKFASIAQRFPSCLPLVMEMREAIEKDNTISLEDELDRLVAISQSDEFVRRQMMALRFYLTEVIASSAEDIFTECEGFTAYVRLLRDIGRWQSREEKEVALVTFNYDTMLDRALRAHVGLKKAFKLEDYVHTQPWRLFKLHGSTDWSREIELGGAAAYPSPDRAIELANQFDPRDGRIVPAAYDKLDSPFKGVVVPAIAMPTVGKPGFECPDDHRQVLEEVVLPAVDRVLIIGWRGVETHVHKVLRDGVSSRAKIAIVDRDKKAAFEVSKNIKSGLTGYAHLFEDAGFHDFTAKRSVIDWLDDM
jgi:hypothetical protein